MRRRFQTLRCRCFWGSIARHAVSANVRSVIIAACRICRRNACCRRCSHFAKPWCTPRPRCRDRCFIRGVQTGSRVDRRGAGRSHLMCFAKSTGCATPHVAVRHKFASRSPIDKLLLADPFQQNAGTGRVQFRASDIYVGSHVFFHCAAQPR